MYRRSLCTSVICIHVRERIDTFPPPPPPPFLAVYGPIKRKQELPPFSFRCTTLQQKKKKNVQLFLREIVCLPDRKIGCDMGIVEGVGLSERGGVF